MRQSLSLSTSDAHRSGTASPAPGAKWLALAVAKPFVRSVSWLASTDAAPHLYPHTGLLRADQTAKPLLPWMRLLRKQTLA